VNQFTVDAFFLQRLSECAKALFLGTFQELGPSSREGPLSNESRFVSHPLHAVRPLGDLPLEFASNHQGDRCHATVSEMTGGLHPGDLAHGTQAGPSPAVATQCRVIGVAHA
jgi:hypothetical protein